MRNLFQRTDRGPADGASAKSAVLLTYFADLHVPGQTGVGVHRPVIMLWRLRVQALAGLRRGVNVAIALLALSFIWPLLAFVALLIRLESPGPVIFCQTRVGKRGTRFICYKFRSMSVDAEARKQALLAQNEVAGPMFKMKRDPRITRLGAVLRKLSIDELPQLINVIKGDMSLVGPRPPVPDEVQYYNVVYLRRLDALPGLTGLPQISGRSNLNFERWVELDLEYIARQGLRQDLIIMLKTVPAVLFGKGAY